jgi:phosphohistidine phosphatase SixA
MKLYFLRHAEAADGMSDAVRPLTKHGEDQACAVGTFLSTSDVVFDAAFTSPLVRAVETAEIVLAITQGKKHVLTLQRTDMLLNEAPGKTFEEWLGKLKKDVRVLLVGHNPSMTEHVNRLLGVKNATPVNLSKGALALVEWEPGKPGELKLLMSPKATGLLKR